MCESACVCAWRREKNTNGDETDTFPDGSANITRPDIVRMHTDTERRTHMLNKLWARVLGLTLEEPMACRRVKLS